MSDVNDVLVNEEEKTVEPRSILLLSDEEYGHNYDKYCFAHLDEGKYIYFLVKNNSDTTLNFGVYIKQKKYKGARIEAQESAIIPYTLNGSTNFRVLVEALGGNNMVASIRVKQYEEPLEDDKMENFLINENEVVTSKMDYLVNHEIITVTPNEPKPESRFTASISQGEYIRIAVRSYNDAHVSVILFVNNKEQEVYKLTPENPSIIIPYKLKKSSTFKIIYEVTNATNIALSVRARQYVEQP